MKVGGVLIQNYFKIIKMRNKQNRCKYCGRYKLEVDGLIYQLKHKCTLEPEISGITKERIIEHFNNIFK